MSIAKDCPRSVFQQGEKLRFKAMTILRCQCEVRSSLAFLTQAVRNCGTLLRSCIPVRSVRAACSSDTTPGSCTHNRERTVQREHNWSRLSCNEEEHPRNVCFPPIDLVDPVVSTLRQSHTLWSTHDSLRLATMKRMDMSYNKLLL